MKKLDGSAGDANCGAIGGGHTRWRQPDPQIAARLHAAFGDVNTVLHIGGVLAPMNRLTGL